MIKYIPFLLPLFFYQTDSTEIYLNEPKTFHISTEESVDYEKSIFTLNGEILNCHESIVFRIEQEGINTFKYQLFNKKGVLIEQGEKTYILDSINPDIKILVDDNEMKDSIGLIESQEITIYVKEENIAKKEVYIDNQLQEEFLETYLLTKENKNIKVIVEDLAGNKTEKEVDIEPLEEVIISSSIQEMYTLNSEIDFESNQSLEEYECLINGQVQDVLMYSFEESGEYDILIRHKKYPYLIPFTQTVIYSLDDLDFSITASSYQANQDIKINTYLNAPYILSSYIKDSLGNVYNFGDEIIYSAKENTKETIHLQGFVQDLFGRQVEKDIDVQISTILPTMSLSIDGKEINNQEEYAFQKIDKVSINTDSLKNDTFFLNKKEESYSSLESALENMDGGDILQYDVELKDEFGNINQYTYFFYKEFVPQVFQQETVNETRDVIEKRVWKVDEKGKVNLVQETEKKIWHPLIYFDAAELIPGKELEIVFMNVEYVKELRVNGNCVDLNKLEKDEFGNWKYVYLIDSQMKSITVEMKDQQGQWTKKTAEIEIRESGFHLSYIVVPVLLLFGFFILKRYV